MADQQKLQAAAQEYQKIQEELQGAVDARQKLESQQHENKGVQSEFKSAKPEETIYKLVGTVLLKQDKEEALSTVDGRLEYIEKEFSRIFDKDELSRKRVEDQIKSIQKKSDEKRSQILQLQSAAQQASADTG